MGLTKKQIDELSSYLKQQPNISEIKEFTRQETIRMISKEIDALKKRGYSLSQIAEILKNGGLTIAPPTLRSYLQRSRPDFKFQRKKIIPRIIPDLII